MDLVLEVHVVDAGLHLESAGLDAEAAFDVVRGLGLQLEILRERHEEGVERRTRGNALIDVRRAERARGAAEHREHVVEAMLETDMQRVLRLAAVERGGLGIEGEWREWIEAVARAQPGVLHPRAVGEVGRRQQADGLLPVAGQRLLRQVVDVDRRNAFERAAVLVERRIVIVDAGQDLSREFRRSSS